jgi:uncharacterized iron-regulated membrane protein
MRKILRHIHLWLSLPFGIIISITCLTGALLVFEKEITACVQHDLRYVDVVMDAPLPTDSLIQRVESALPQGVVVTKVTPSANPRRTYQVRISKPRNTRLFVDPYTGEVKGRDARLPFFTTTLKLHRFLLGKRDAASGIFWGKNIVGVSTLMFVFILLTGVVLWWPKSLKALRNLATIHFNGGWRRFWYDLHVVAGMYVLVFLLAMALTGLVWSFGWYREAFYALFGTLGRGTIYAIHSGSWGGMVTRILAFMAALLGATLPLTGYYLWIKRLLSKKKKSPAK